MSATTGGALKAALEMAGTGIPWFRDVAPDRQPVPYGTIQESLSLTTELSGDERDPAAPLVGGELVQVDLWQAWRDAAGRPVENYGLPGLVVRALRAADLPTPTRTYGLTGIAVARLLERDANVVHHAITATVRRRL
jgi:hypothetical protein